MPIFLLADGYNDTSVWYYPPLFTLSLMIISLVWTWMRLKSGSVWPGVVCLVFGLWVGRGVESRFALHGLLVGIVATLL
jgi:membrane protease YdiL (CAAX protease family)